MYEACVKHVGDKHRLHTTNVILTHTLPTHTLCSPVFFCTRPFSQSDKESTLKTLRNNVLYLYLQKTLYQK